MNRSRRRGEVPNLDLNIFVHWCTPVAFGMRHGHRISGYSSHGLLISALERALIDDLFDDIFLVFVFFNFVFSCSFYLWISNRQFFLYCPATNVSIRFVWDTISRLIVFFFLSFLISLISAVATNQNPWCGLVFLLFLTVIFFRR